MPVVVGDTVLVNSHTFGLVATRITREGGHFKATEAWANKALKINISTPVLVGEHLYSQGASRDFVCVEATTGKLKWSQSGFGRGTKDYSSAIAVGNRLLVSTDDGQLVQLDANPDKYTEMGRAQVCGNTWSHPAFADGRLYVRDGRDLQCFALSVPKPLP
jgi:outer membrane protein assembly factor BamB